MAERTPDEFRAVVERLGPSERLLELILNFPDHLWHNRPGVVEKGKWRSATAAEVAEVKERGKLSGGRAFQPPGPNVAAIEKAYSALGDIWLSHHELAARLASYVMRETDWKDMKVVCAAFMLVQSRAGEPVFDDSQGVRKALFFDDDYRDIGEAMIKLYERGSNRMMSPKMILRVGEVLSLPEVAELNKVVLSFGNPQKRKPFLGRYPKAVEDWLRYREMNMPLLEGLKRAGYKGTIRSLARRVGYRPTSQRFFEILDWPQKQHRDGHRQIGLVDLNLEKRGLTGLGEREICERIVADRLGYKQVMGMLPPEVGLTPAIFVALLDTLSDKDLTILTPTLEELGLLRHPQIKERWEGAIQGAEDQRARHVARNVRGRGIAERLEVAADGAVAKAVGEATAGANMHIMFLIDKSGSMEGAIEKSKEALSRILQGFDQNKLHIACFDTMGTVLRPKHASHAGVAHMLSAIQASGGTIHAAALTALHRSGVRVPEGADLIVFVVGDEDGERPAEFAKAFGTYGYRPSAFAHIVNFMGRRGSTVRGAAEALAVPYSEVNVEQFHDPYQVQRSLKAILEAAPLKTKVSLVEKIMTTELLVKPY